MSSSEATRVLSAVASGESGRREELFALLYDELRRIASTHLAREDVSHTLQPTALVHEAWIRLIDQESLPNGGRSHFLSVASMAMRRILVDHARTKSADKRGGGARKLDLSRIDLVSETRDEIDLLALDEQLRALAERSDRQAKIIELRFFGGLMPPDIAAVLGTSLSTVEREWRFARAWLLARL